MPTTNPADYIRPELLAFACRMEAKLRENDHKPGWGDDAPLALFGRIREETDELYGALIKAESGLPLAVEAAADEAADVANMAMMVADVVQSRARV